MRIVRKLKGKKDWKLITSAFNHTTPLQCFIRYHAIKQDINHGAWTKDEDDQIMNLIYKFGKKWSLLAKKYKDKK